MSDKGTIVAGLVVFLALAAFPFWYALGVGGDVSPPDLELPTDATQCVEDTEYMKAEHMDLLNRWRDAVVRDGEREYTSESGEKYTMSLTGTCLGCHADREAFCDRCHDYANVEPSCWDCHLEPKGN
ncbi:MAG: sulfate reduction electron transfer complex DsrMKJOP subunit DsrJ [Planctomycetota bacterium]